MQKDNGPQKIDRRTRYTQSVIKEAFIQLIKQMPVEKITVTQICKIAEINRATFYIHYENPFDVLKKIENEYGHKILEYTRQIMNDGQYHHDLALSMHKAIASDDTLRFLITSNPSSINILQQVFGEVEKIVNPNLIRQFGFSEEVAHLVFAFLFAGSNAVSLYLLNKNASPEEIVKIADIINDLTWDGLRGYKK